MRRLAIALVPLLLFACDRQPVAPSIDDGPALNWMNNPDNGNPKILRYEWSFTISWTDPTNGLRASHTTNPGLWAGQGCGPTSPVALVETQDVVQGPIELESRWIEVGQATDIWIVVRDVTQAGDCFGALLVAEGTGRLTYNDNDYFSYLANRANVNTWGFRAQGNLTAVDGTILDYNGLMRQQYQPDGVGGEAKGIFKVNLH